MSSESRRTLAELVRPRLRIVCKLGEEIPGSALDGGIKRVHLGADESLEVQQGLCPSVRPGRHARSQSGRGRVDRLDVDGFAVAYGALNRGVIGLVIGVVEVAEIGVIGQERRAGDRVVESVGDELRRTEESSEFVHGVEGATGKGWMQGDASRGFVLLGRNGRGNESVRTGFQGVSGRLGLKTCENRPKKESFRAGKRMPPRRLLSF